MKTNFSIQLKAGILLVVFALNTIVGFACAVGIDMGFNSHHHNEEAAELTLHTHADGMQHHHEADNQDKKSNDSKDNCCKDKVTKIAQADKSLPPSNSVINPLFLAAFISSQYNFDITGISKASPALNNFVRSRHPTISDIRIAIQSFQI